MLVGKKIKVISVFARDLWKPHFLVLGNGARLDFRRSLVSGSFTEKRLVIEPKTELALMYLSTKRLYDELLKYFIDRDFWEISWLLKEPFVLADYAV